MQAPEEEATHKKVAQVATIHEATQEGKNSSSRGFIHLVWVRNGKTTCLVEYHKYF